MKPQFLIAAPHSGAGKTTITLGILRALSNRGLSVQAFKCGPDYLDPKLHTVACGQKSINLDRFMMDDEHIEEVYRRYGSKADVLVTEGVMGLFDGAVKMEGSSADLARLLHIPVIMVVNAKAMAYSVAALLLGFKTLCKDIHIAGVIFNFVAHESHYNLLKEAAADVGIMALGYLPNRPEIQIPSRHLGLKTGSEIDHDGIIAEAAAHIEKYVNLDELLRISNVPLVAPQLQQSDHHQIAYTEKVVPIKKPKRIWIANDEAFNFTYVENIAALASLGEINYFSPLKDTALPPADLIYLPGGYPELHLEALSANKTLRAQLYAYAQNGGKILAECGGMMYLGKYITDENGKEYPMTGILDIATGMQHKKLAIGYKRVAIGGTELRGHEFHYSQFIYAQLPESQNQKTQEKEPVIQIWNARNEPLHLPVFSTPNLLASYFHFYFGNTIKAIESLLWN